MSVCRNVCCLVLKVAIPLMVLQVLFVAPMPDAFGVNQDLATLKNPKHITYINSFNICAVDRFNDVGFMDSLRKEVAFYPIVRAVRRKIWSNSQKLPPPDGADDPLVFAITEDLVFLNTDPVPCIDYLSIFSSSANNFSCRTGAVQTARAPFSNSFQFLRISNHFTQNVDPGNWKNLIRFQGYKYNSLAGNILKPEASKYHF